MPRDVYQNVVDSVTEGDTSAREIGRKVIFPSSHVGSKRNRYGNYQDAMAVMRKSGPKADVFLTVTTNTRWCEILEAPKPGQLPQDRPDIIARVFKMKLKILEDDIIKNGIFGRRVAHLRVIEFQKRGLPYAH